MKMSRRIECRSEGCTHEVLFKTVDGAFDDRRGSGRTPLSPTGRGSPSGPHHRHGSNSIQVSPYCKHHTCTHFHGDERCVYKKPPHDTVCAIHARCPVPNCTQARAQFLEPNFDPLSNAVPKYARFEVCSDHKCALQRCPGRRASSRSSFCQAHACQAEDCVNLRQEQRNCCTEHQCKTAGCRAIAESEYPYCATHIKCQMNGCKEPRHPSARTHEYLAFCADHVTCPMRGCTALKTEHSPYCADHTCLVRNCSTATSCELYCSQHSCAALACSNPRDRTSKPENCGKYCPLHTCRVERCQAQVDTLALFCATHGCSKPKCHQKAVAEQLCVDHFKDHYIAQGRQLCIDQLRNQYGTAQNKRQQQPLATTIRKTGSGLHPPTIPQKKKLHADHDDPRELDHTDDYDHDRDYGSDNDHDNSHRRALTTTQARKKGNSNGTTHRSDSTATASAESTDDGSALPQRTASSSGSSTLPRSSPVARGNQKPPPPRYTESLQGVQYGGRPGSGGGDSGNVGERAGLFVTIPQAEEGNPRGNGSGGRQPRKRRAQQVHVEGEEGGGETQESEG